MINLATNYMGIELKNPIIAGASGMSSDLNMLKKLDEAGADGLVLFNRFYQPDFDLESLEIVSGAIL